MPQLLSPFESGGQPCCMFSPPKRNRGTGKQSKEEGKNINIALQRPTVCGKSTFTKDLESLLFSSKVATYSISKTLGSASQLSKSLARCPPSK